MDKNYEYDVAVSFLHKDLGIAQSIRDALSPQFKVFEFNDRQKEIAGTDGLETFKSVFRHDSRLVVILYDTPWGESGWTRVEKEAVQERFLNDGWNFLFFVMVDAKCTPPNWYPQHRMRFNWSDYGLTQAVGAIKYRLQELGAAIREESVVERAARTAAIRAFSDETRRLWSTSEGVQQATGEAFTVINSLAESATKISVTVPSLELEVARPKPTFFAARTRGLSLKVGWNCQVINDLSDAFLGAEIIQGEIIFPGESKFYIEQPRILRRLRYSPARINGLGSCWTINNVNLLSSEVEKQIFGAYMDQITR